MSEGRRHVLRDVAENQMQVTVADDLAVAIGDRSTQLSPGQAFKLAERLIRQATVHMIAEEADRADVSSHVVQPAPR